MRASFGRAGGARGTRARGHPAAPLRDGGRGAGGGDAAAAGAGGSAPGRAAAQSWLLNTELPFSAASKGEPLLAATQCDGVLLQVRPPEGATPCLADILALLQVAQALLQLGSAPQLVVLTRGAQRPACLAPLAAY